MSGHAHGRPLTLSLRLESVAAAVIGAALAGGVAAVDGGFFPESWAWVSVTTLAISTVLLIVRSGVSLRLLDLLYLGGLLAFGSWVAVSAAWSNTVTGAVEDAWRMLAYVGAVALCLLVVERRSVPALLGGVLAGVVTVAGYALLTRLLPDRLGDFASVVERRLAEPIGYWNGLGVYCVMGSLLAIGLAARATRRVTRVAAGVGSVVLLTTTYLTFSRGAWLALIVGFAAAVALDSRRLQLVVTALNLAPWIALSVLFASRADAFSTEGSTLMEAIDQGHTLLIEMTLVCVAAGIAIAIQLREERVRTFGRRARTATVAGLIVVGLVGIGWVWTAYDSSWGLAGQAGIGGPRTPGVIDESDRIFELSSSGRRDLWRIALDDFRAAPVLGFGAGSFEQSYYEQRRDDSLGAIRDAHSLYVETLGELGAIGLVLIALSLAVPLIAAVRARRHPFAAPALGVYAAFLVHAGVDWDFELAGVTLVALLAAGALVILARGERPPQRITGWVRPCAIALSSLLAALAVWSLLVNVPLGRAREAAGRSDWSTGIDEAKKASRWAPWASDPWRLRGDGEVALGRVVAARRSYRTAVVKDPREWLLWLKLALVSSGPQKLEALERARVLNPKNERVRMIEAAARNRERRS